MTARALRKRAGGFTLVELMAVVAIVGVLSVLAVVSYGRLVQSSKTTEAIQMVNSLRLAQEAYKGETGVYADVSDSFAWDSASPSLYPNSALGRKVTAWGAPCGAKCKTGIDWRSLPVHVDGPVAFGYSTVARSAATTALPAININGQAMVWPAVLPTEWFIVSAVGDVNEDRVYCSVLGTSFTNQVFVNQDGE